MFSPVRVSTCLAVFVFALFAQNPATDPPPPEPRLPSGRLQRDEILKAEHAKSIEDAQQLIRLSEELKTELEKDTQYVFSIAAVKRTEEIEKVARRIRSRMKSH
jgi:hypothetical protein